ncbi:hypothetical protein niasHT_029449 [Heterodera trifolii]|uniref:Uncharacterized protein n=1 Tax=Heterodera trifolii TaxID=157864 RepID=A0ABD2KQF0_9BILA
MQDEMEKNGGRLYMKEKIEFDKLKKNKTKPTENQKGKERNLNVESDEEPLLGADQLADDEGYEYEEPKIQQKIGKMPSKSRNGESSHSKGRSGTPKQRNIAEYSPESSPTHNPIQTPRGQHEGYGNGASGHYDQQNLAGYGTSQKQTEMMGANREFMGGQGATMPAGYGGASPAGQGNYVPVPIPIEVENGGESSNEEQDDRDAELQNSGSDEATHIGNDSNSDHGELHPGFDNNLRNEEEQSEIDDEEDQRQNDNENEDNSEEVENSTENKTSPAQSAEGELDGQTTEEEKSGDEQDQSSSEESKAGRGEGGEGRREFEKKEEEEEKGEEEEEKGGGVKRR